jgi:hypothetical protein
MDQENLPVRKSDFFIGLDLGQRNDWSAGSLVQRTVYPKTRQPPTFEVTRLRRWPLDTPFIQIVRDTLALLRPGPDGRYPLPGVRLVVDATGVGKPVVELLREPLGSLERFEVVKPIIITGGSGHRFDADRGVFSVAKVELVGALLALEGTGRLKIATDVPEAKTVAAELATFSSKLTPAGDLTYEALRARDHDDLVLSVVLPLWYAMQPSATFRGVEQSGFAPVVSTEGWRNPAIADDDPQRQWFVF